jgi:hypothetical protein
MIYEPGLEPEPGPIHHYSRSLSITDPVFELSWVASGNMFFIKLAYLCTKPYLIYIV